MAVDFVSIAGIASDAIQLYGTPVEYVEVGASTGRMVKSVIYQDKTTAALLQDSDSAPAMALLDPADFPSGLPQKFAQIRCSIGGFTGSWTLVADAHPILAQNTLPLYTAELRRN
jgi:hypothetical protein